MTQNTQCFNLKSKGNGHDCQPSKKYIFLLIIKKFKLHLIS